MNRIRPEQQKLYSIYVPLVLFLIAFFWKFAYIGTRDVCMDEPFTIFHAQKSVKEILILPSQNEPNPPLFMLLLHFWIELFGNSPYSVRILPLLFNALTVVFIYFTGKKFFNMQVALFASALFLFSTYHFYFALETRAYSLLSLGTAASLYYFLSFVENDKDRRMLAGLIVSNIVLVYAHYFGWFAVLIQFLGILLYVRDFKKFLRLMLPLVITGIAFSPMAYLFVKQFLKSSKGTWVQPPGDDEYMAQIHMFFNAKTVYDLLIWFLAAGLLFKLLSNNRKPASKRLITIFLWWFIPYTFMYYVSEKVPMFINRYILFNSVGLYLFAAAFLSYLFGDRKFITGLLFTIAAWFMFRKIEINSKEFYYREVNNAVNYVKTQSDGQHIVIIHPHWTSLNFSYYYNRQIFNDTKHYDEHLAAESIYPVYNVMMARDYVKQNPGKRIIYYQDGSALIDPDATIMKFLDSNFVRRDSVFFPQCFNITVFEPGRRDSVQP